MAISIALQLPNSVRHLRLDASFIFSKRSSKTAQPESPAVKSQGKVPERNSLDMTKRYLTVSELSEKIGAQETEIHSAIRFGALIAAKFPVRGARLFRIEEDNAKSFARKFYAKLI